MPGCALGATPGSGAGGARAAARDPGRTALRHPVLGAGAVRGPRLLGPEAAGVRMQAGLHSSCRGLQKTRPLFLIIMPLRGLGLRTERDPAGKRRCLQVSLWLRGRARPSPEQEAVAAVGPEGGATRPAPPPKARRPQAIKAVRGSAGPRQGLHPQAPPALDSPAQVPPGRAWEDSGPPSSSHWEAGQQRWSRGAGKGQGGRVGWENGGGMMGGEGRGRGRDGGSRVTRLGPPGEAGGGLTTVLRARGSPFLRPRPRCAPGGSCFPHHPARVLGAWRARSSL